MSAKVDSFLASASLEDIRDLQERFAGSAASSSTSVAPSNKPSRAILDLLGKKVFIRTVTHFTVGILREFDGKYLHIEQGVWIGDTGPFQQFLASGNASEIAEYPSGQKAYVAEQGIIDIFEFMPAAVHGRGN